MPGAPALFQDTFLDVSSHPSRVLQINTHGGTSGTIVGNSRKRPFDEISGYDEETFANKHLATEGSVYFRPKHRAPRCFLWRVLQDRQLLEVQCVDLVQEQKNAQSGVPLTFHITLHAPIIRGGVALADAGEKDAIEIFILTTSNELHTVTLQRDILVRDSLPLNFDSTLYCKKFSSGSFGFRSPYRIVAASNLELFVSLHDGGLLRLDRKPHETGAQWRETFFSEGGWRGTFKGMIRLGRAQTVRWGNLELDSNAIAAIAKCPNGKHVWTVSLDHTLKAWSTETGKIAAQSDLLNEDFDQDDRKQKAQYIFGADQGSLLQVVELPSHENERSIASLQLDQPYFLVVYSPKDHQFKFFRVSTTFGSVEGEKVILDDLLPKTRLIPPVDELLNTNLWHLEQFAVNPGKDWQKSQLWIRARSGAICTTFTLFFDLPQNGKAVDVSERWQTGWTVVDSASFLSAQLKAHPECTDPVNSNEATPTPQERWLDFLFLPGRFTQAALETALNIYRKGRSLPNLSSTSPSGLEESLKERLLAAIQAKIPLRRLANERPDYAQYQAAIQDQWMTFYSVLSHIQARRRESIKLAFDPLTGLAWLVGADYISPIRENSTFEKLCNNTSHLMSGDIDDMDEDIVNRIYPGNEEISTSQILAVAHQFRKYFTEVSQEKLKQATSWAAFSPNEDKTPEVTLESLYRRCGFENEISSDDWDEINSSAEQFGGLGSLSVDNFLMVLEELEDAPRTPGKDQAKTLCYYGNKLSIAIAQETLQRAYAVLLDLLALVVFMAGDLEPSGLHKDFRPHEVYETIMLRVRQTDLRLWLVTNVRPSSLSDGSSLAESSPVTLYQSMFIRDWSALSDKKTPDRQAPHLAQLLTSWSKRWTFGLTLTRNWDEITGFIMANLLKHKNIELAAAFIKFLAEGSWPAYLKARLYVAVGEYDAASLFFKEAADELSAIENLDPRATGFLFSDEELNTFGHGLSRYYQHVSSLFENLKVFSYTAHFAEIALQSLESDSELDQSIAELDFRKSMTDSPADEKIDVVMEEIRILRRKEQRDDILNRLFNALVQTGRFELAFSNLVHVNNPDMQHACLQTLLQTCVKQDAIQTLLHLPIPASLLPTADDILLAFTKQSFAKPSSSAPPYHQILFAFRVRHANFRDAATILYEHLERLQSSKKSRFTVQDPDDETLVKLYVLLINTLACCAAGESWFLADPLLDIPHGAKKRRLVTLDDVRREYSAELDRRSDVAQGRFPVVGPNDGEEDEMDVF